ncbi:MAG TPA: hypothetical protein VF735_06720 [Pyrinomonadaceae bacterium]|jgi:hypothetical protein
MSVHLIFVLVPLEADRPNDIVGWEYIHERTGLAERTIKDRKGGVKEIPLARRKPLGWFRGHVDKWLQDSAQAAQTPRTRAFKLLDRSRMRKRSKEVLHRES